MTEEPQDPAVAATLVREAPDMIMTLDRAGRILEANPATLRESGFTLEEVRARPIESFMPGLDPMRVAAARERLADGTATPVTVRYHRKDGALRWLSVRIAPLPQGTGAAALLVFARDVTDDILRTQALRDSDQRFRSLVSAFDRAFFVVDPDLRVAGLFGRWVRSAGLKPGEWLGRTMEELFPANGGEPHTSNFRRALAGQDVTYEWDYTVPASGEVRRLRLHLSPMRDGDGSVSGIAGVAADITRRVRAEAEADALRAQMAESERAQALGKLVSGVAHELNNPLAAVLNFTEDLLHTEHDPERRAALEVVRSQALRSRTIVRDLLTFARRGGHRPLTPQAPGPILESVALAVRPGLSRGVTLVASIEDGGVGLDLDRSGFEQVITNLIANAAQAAPKDGHIELRAAREGDQYVISVSDDGAGIPHELMGRIFEPFFTTKSTGQGVGLGLSVSLGIVQEHGGTLEAANRADRPGATFVVRLPLSKQAPAAPTPPLGVAAVSRTRIATPPEDAPGLLIVDDEEPIRHALRRYFQRKGWRVDEAGDGYEGLALLTAPGAESRYVAVLCDLRMPGLDGPKLYAKVQEQAPALLNRFIISTGDTSNDAAASFLDTIDAPVLEKPFELSEVAAVLERFRKEFAAPR